MRERRSQKMAGYYRISCIDGQSYSHIPLKEHVSVAGDDFRRGKISDSSVLNALINVAKKKTKDGSLSGPISLMAQWGSYALSGPRAVQTRSKYPQNICFLTAVVSMDLDGRFSMAQDGSSPTVPRGILGPKASISFADVDEYDRYLSHNRWADSLRSESWQGFIEYGEALIRELCADSPEGEGYEAQDTVYLSYFDGGSRALNEVISQYDRIERTDLDLPCFDTIVGARPFRELSVPAPLDTIAIRIAQMKADFPLAKAQRDTLSAALVADTGDIVALNGPPGTGKTTLLQNVVACLFTQAALENQPAPLIWAASANNQPVTNIIESFSATVASAPSKYEPLNRVGFMQRWLPAGDKLTFGLYMASKKRAATTDYLTEDKLVELLRAPGLAETRAYFMRSFHAAFDGDGRAADQATPGDACRFMRRRLVEIHARLELITLNIRIEKLKAIVEQLEAAKRSWHKTIRTASFLEKIFSWLGPFKMKRRNHLHGFIDDENIFVFLSKTQQIMLKDSVIPDGNWTQFLTILQKRLVELRRYLARYQQQREACRVNSGVEGQINENSGVEGQINEVARLRNGLSVQHVDEQLDTTLRVEAFWLAVHIFEARWIAQTPMSFWGERGATKMPRWTSSSPKGIAERLRLFAMLTPCLVSTFHKLPSHLKGYLGKDSTGDWLVDSLWNEIDLLIVDEAGQIPPELAAGSFALAKRALVVGDILQIEPVWSVPEIIDRANIERVFGQEAFAGMHEQGRVASTGNLMRMAQDSTPFQRTHKLGPGMHLNEHRRCTEPIIQYCNALCYQNFLKPMRPDDDRFRTMLGLPAMGWHHIDGRAQVHGGSRRNRPEAKAIADWISAHRKHLESLYDQRIEDVLGVVTPFKAQAELITHYLGKYSADEITVGTVHALQGAERAVVLFSGVYSRNTGASTYFFDRGPNMLNVAVSRAKDSFLVFGDMQIYQGDASLPSGLLGQYLQSSGHEVAKAPRERARVHDEG